MNSPRRRNDLYCADFGSANSIPRVFNDVNNLLLHANLLLFDSIARMSGDNTLDLQNTVFCPLMTTRRMI
jgi:hypothetical protein